MAKHEHGSMDTTAQERTFSSFVTWVVRTIAVCIALLIFLALING